MIVIQLYIIIDIPLEYINPLEGYKYRKDKTFLVF